MNDYYLNYNIVKGSVMRDVKLKWIAEQTIKYSGFDIRSKRKPEHLILLRKVYYKLSRKYTKEIHSKIGSEVHCNYATVLHALSTVDKDLKDYPMFNDLYIKIERKITGSKWSKVYKKPKESELKTSVLNGLVGLSDKDMLDFEDTRLKPYLTMLKSRRVHNITEVKGALLRN